MINETINTAMEISKTSYTASLIILWATTIIFLPIVTLLLKQKKQNWGRFWLIWFFVALISGIVLIFLVVSPDFISSSIIKLKEFFI